MKRKAPIVVGTMLALASLAGCYNEATAPILSEAAKRRDVTSGDIAVAAMAASAHSNRRSFRSSDNHEYTYDASTSTITDDRGRKAKVDPADRARVDHAFRKIGMGDNILTSIERDPGYRRCLAEARKLGISVKTRLQLGGSKGLSLDRMTSTTPVGSVIRRSIIAAPRGRELPTTGVRSGYLDDYGWYGDLTCYQASVSLWSLTERWNQLKGAYLGLILEALAAGGSIKFTDAWEFEYSLHQVAGYLYAGGVALEADLMSTLIQLNVAAYTLKSHNCIYGTDGTYPLISGTGGGGGGEGGGGANDCPSSWGELWLVYDDGTEVKIWEGYVSDCEEAT